MYTKSGAESHPSFPRLRKWARRLSIDPERGPFDRVIISLTRDGKLRVQVTGEFESTSTSWGPPNVYSSVGGDYNIAGERSQRTVDVNVRNLIELLELSPGRWRVTLLETSFRWSPEAISGRLRKSCTTAGEQGSLKQRKPSHCFVDSLSSNMVWAQWGGVFPSVRKAAASSCG